MTPEQVLDGRPRRRAYWHSAFTLAVLVAVVWLARRHWPVLETGVVRLTVADQGWLLVGAAATLLTWPCSALAQQGAVPHRLPPGRLVAAQFGASAANHVLPAGLGAGAVNLRFLMRCGIPLAAAATAVAVKGAAGASVRGTLIAVLVAAHPGVLHLPHVGGGYLVAVCAVTVAAAALLTGTLWGRCRRAHRPCRRIPARRATPGMDARHVGASEPCDRTLPHARTGFARLVRGCPHRRRPGPPFWRTTGPHRPGLAAVRAYLAAVHARPARAAALWGGSLAFVTLHCAALVAVTRAVALPLPPALVALLYLAAGTAAALLPTPGGFGSLDAALALALTAVGAPAAAAASAVLGYRLLTVWLPLLPGLLVLAVLVRRRAL
ncbi:lysylphosphatidylglycerol synthase domain-containing protein [Streptomyces sp. CA-251387]|uniref:lysylphosphatidylglycerol synthase domain-containing protein n=1 Tax=Streptomyces sp. CA-251387 TaxID=3240064 RepID=UPI003D93A85C